MKIVKSREDLRRHLGEIEGIGFVPTMGALHDGHISLVNASKAKGLHTVVSIFVNPTQFNNPADLEKYPIDIEGDLAMLEESGCDVVYIPSKEDVYRSGKEDERYLHDFGDIELRYEGAFRPGHFRGVGQVVHILFEIVQPDFAFFGEKDFQQLQVIRKLVEKTGMEVKIVGISTVREPDGLAMSSRNRRLSPNQRLHATLLNRALSYAKNNVHSSSPDAIRSYVQKMFFEDDVMELEYFDLIDPNTFQPIAEGTYPSEIHSIISAYAGEVRLIDNMRLA